MPGNIPDFINMTSPLSLDNIAQVINDVVVFFKNQNMVVYHENENQSLFSFINQINTAANDAKNSSITIGSKINNALGAKYSLMSPSQVSAAFNSLVNKLDLIKEANGEAKFDKTAISLFDLLLFMVDNSGGSGSGAGFTEEELSFIETNIKPKILSTDNKMIDDTILQIVEPSEGVEGDSGALQFIKLTGLVWNNLNQYIIDNESVISNLDTRIVTNENAITNLDTNLSTDISNLDTRVTEDISNLDGRVTINENTIDNLSTDISENKSKLGKFDTAIDNINKITQDIIEQQRDFNYSLNTIRMLGNNRNIITKTMNEYEATIKMGIYIYNDLVLIDKYYYHENPTLNGKIEYMIDYIETYLYTLGEVNKIPMLTILNNDEIINIEKKFMLDRLPVHYKKTDMIYQTDVSKEDFGNIININDTIYSDINNLIVNVVNREFYTYDSSNPSSGIVLVELPTIDSNRVSLSYYPFTPTQTIDPSLLPNTAINDGIDAYIIEYGASNNIRPATTPPNDNSVVIGSTTDIITINKISLGTSNSNLLLDTNILSNKNNNIYVKVYGHIIEDGITRPSPIEFTKNPTTGLYEFDLNTIAWSTGSKEIITHFEFNGEIFYECIWTINI